MGDSDIDVYIISLTDSEEFKEFKEEMRRRGYMIGEEFESSKHFYKNNVLLDIWTFMCLDDSKDFFSTFDDVSYCGRKYNLPHPVEDYLKHFYGDWSEPTQ